MLRTIVKTTSDSSTRMLLRGGVLTRRVGNELIRSQPSGRKFSDIRWFTTTKILKESDSTIPVIKTVPEIPMSSHIRISEGAVKQIKYVQKRDQNPNEALKVVIDSGGCHGFKIMFDLTDTVEEDDILFELEGAKVLVNKAFLPLIAGSTLDFTEELIGSTFKLIDNPNAASGCGCGISFELK